VAFGLLDLSGPYRETFNDVLPSDATQVTDPFHLVKPAPTRSWTSAAGGCRTRRSGTWAASTSCRGPAAEVRATWHATEVVRSVYEINANLAGEFVDRLGSDLQDASYPGVGATRSASTSTARVPSSRPASFLWSWTGGADRGFCCRAGQSPQLPR
jgi:hypothetical protein